MLCPWRCISLCDQKLIAQMDGQVRRAHKRLQLGSHVTARGVKKSTQEQLRHQDKFTQFAHAATRAGASPGNKVTQMCCTGRKSLA